MASKVTTLSNPFILDALNNLRNKDTEVKKFREYSDKVCSQLMSMCLGDDVLVERTIATPISEVTGKSLEGDFVFVCVLRAGLAMLQSACTCIPDVRVGFVGLARDEETAIAKEYYAKLPPITSQTIVIIGDPMLATGGSSLQVIEKVMEYQPKAVYYVGVIAAPEGIEAVQEKFPQVKITVAAIDEKLNDKKYIVPGLGDYGDRYFGT